MTHVLYSYIIKMADKYIKLDQRSHVLTRPNMYIGSIDEDTYNTFIYDKNENKMIKKNIKLIPGLYKIFDEILVNAIDHITRLKSESNIEHYVKNIKISIDRDTNIISITNDGEGIEIEKHNEYDIYIPELIFGHLLTSSNYDDNKERIIGGCNGIGSKAVAIFSSYFKIITIDHKKGLKYTQIFEDNLSKINKPSITKYTRKPFTTIEFKPDYEKFKTDNLSDDMYDIMIKRVYDMCAITDNDISIYLNSEKIEYKNFEKYTSLYIGSDIKNRVYEKINDRWEVIVSINKENTGFEQISFVNGIWTIRGGKHVDCIINQVCKKLLEMITKKNKNINITQKTIKDSLIVFVKCIIPNPTFDSQSKEILTTPMSKIKVEVSDKFIDKIYKLGIVNKLLEFSNIQNIKLAQKTDGKKKSTIKGIPELEDANWAGTSKSNECTLILTEGLSASSMAIAGISSVGKNKYGVFPLRGKILNVKDVSDKKIIDNIEISNIKKILGLQSNKDYTSSKQELRYNSVMLLVDQDFDASHIKGLLFNVFHTLWPSLIKNDGFIVSMLTPIVKAKKGTEIIEFYNISDYNKWKETLTNVNQWNIKYYKGLGTSNNQEAKQYFKDMKKIDYKWTDDSDEVLNLAFNKKRADDRKSWLSNYDKDNVIDYGKDMNVTYPTFVNKDLIHFSNYDIERSIPSMIDGLKTSQRKILYSCFKRNLTDKEIRVSQLAAYVSENTSYHHGEASLQSTIVGMAQDFVGSNNINLLMPNGQFGCLDPYTKLYDFNLNIKLAKDIKVGDKLIGDDGTSRTVLKIVSGIDTMYRVNILENNKFSNELIVNKEHILTLSYKNNKTPIWNYEKEIYEYKYFDSDTFEIKITTDLKDIKNETFDIKITDFLENFGDIINQFAAIKNYSIIEYEKVDTTIDPYSVGFFKANIRDEYIINDKNFRFSILAGIIDRYGYVKYFESKPHCYIKRYLFSYKYINKLKLLTNSLGLILKITRFYIIIYGIHLDMIPTKIVFNNIYFFKDKDIDYEDYKYDFTIEKINNGHFCGWAVDKNERFLVEDFIITHNSRIHGGKDAGQSRYINTMLSKECNIIFNKDDKNILNYLEDDGIKIEPEYYVPNLPMILINGALGIATGFSTNIPCYNPSEILKLLKMLLNNENIDDYELKPWYRNFKGDIIKKDSKYYSKGIYKVNGNKITIKELPIGVWIYDYKCHLEDLLEKGIIKSYENNSSEVDVNIIITLSDNTDKLMTDIETNTFTKFENTFKMVTSKGLSTTNMYAFNENRQIQKFNSPIDIIKQFHLIKLKFFQKRKDYICNNIEKDLSILNNKIRFINDVVSETIIVHKMKKIELESYLDENNYNKYNDNYDYIIKIPIYNITIDKVDSLKQEKNILEQKLCDIKDKSIENMWQDELIEYEKIDSSVIVNKIKKCRLLKKT